MDWIGLDWRATYREVNFSAVRAVPRLSGQRHCSASPSNDSPCAREPPKVPKAANVFCPQTIDSARLCQVESRSFSRADTLHRVRATVFPKLQEILRASERVKTNSGPGCGKSRLKCAARFFSQCLVTLVIRVHRGHVYLGTV